MAALITLTLSSCMPKFSSAFYYTDYSTFMDKGFFITESNTVPFEYIPVGSLFIRQKAGKIEEMSVVHQKSNKNLDYDEIYVSADNKDLAYNITKTSDSSTDKKKKSKKDKDSEDEIVVPSQTSALLAAYEFAKANNADGIINISFDYYIKDGRYTLTLKGMLIKRK